MQNNIIKQDLLDNSADTIVVINPTKQQLAFFPKEESQMMTSKTKNHLGTPGAGVFTDPVNETVNNDTLAFVERAKIENTDPIAQIDWAKYSSPSLPTSQGAYKYKTDSINSSHTATDYIGATTIEVPTIIQDTFSTFRLFNLQTAAASNFYPVSDTAQRIKTVFSGLQTLRIPQDVFNTILTDETAIIANNNSSIVKNYGSYFILVAPLYIRSAVGTITTRYQAEFLSEFANGTGGAFNSNEQIVPTGQRRTVYQTSKSNFLSLPWNFEGGARQAGRLYGSVVEVWDSTESVLKQTKIMTENDFHFNDTGIPMSFVLYPDNVGYDSPSQEVATGDILRIFPRETYFNQFIVQVDYKNVATQVENMVAFMTNDVVRDMSSGIFSIYDSNGVTINSDGTVNGTVDQSYQVVQYSNLELRKKIKK